MKKDPVLILANPNGNAWDFAKSVYDKLSESKQPENNSNLLSRAYGNLATVYKKFIQTPEQEQTYELRKVEITKFNNREIFPKILKSIRKKECYFIQDSSMPPQDWLASLQFLGDAFMRSSKGYLNLVLPNMWYMRQDRMTEPGTPISAKVVAEKLDKKADRIITTDLHNPITQGFFDLPFDNLKAYPTLIKYLKRNEQEFLKNCKILSPDSGSAERAETYANRLGLDYAVTHKKRKSAGVIESIKIIGKVKDQNILIPDDMIDTAGTLCEVAKIAKEQGAKHIYACATHGIFSTDKKGATARQKLQDSVLEKIIITDSIPQKPGGKIEVVSLTDLFANVIYRISHGISVHELFD